MAITNFRLANMYWNDDNTNVTITFCLDDEISQAQVTLNANDYFNSYAHGGYKGMQDLVLSTLYNDLSKFAPNVFEPKEATDSQPAEEHPQV